MSEAQQKANATEHDIKEQVYAINKHMKESSEADSKIKQMLESHDWIEHERHLFGQKDSLYDFKASNPKELSKRWNIVVLPFSFVCRNLRRMMGMFLNQ